MTPTSERTSMSHRHSRGRNLARYIPVVIIGLAMVGVLAMGWHRHLSLESLVKHRSALEEFVSSHALGALSAFIGIYIVAVALSMPGAVFLTIAGGFLFGWLVGGGMALIGASIGAGAIFLIASSAFGGVLMRRPNPLVARVAEGFHANAFSYLLFLRLVPVFPFWLVNLAAALVGIRLSTFMAATVIGIIPGTFAYASLGAGLDSVIAAQEAAFRQCVNAGRADCRLDFDLGAAFTPQMIGALVALGFVGLVPIALKRLRKTPSDLAP